MLGTIVDGAEYPSGIQTMDTNNMTRPGTSHPSSPVSGTDVAALLPSVDLGAIGLAAASGLLRMRVADLGSLLAAHAEADLVCCPVCRTHPRRAA